MPDNDTVRIKHVYVIPGIRTLGTLMMNYGDGTESGKWKNRHILIKKLNCTRSLAASDIVLNSTAYEVRRNPIFQLKMANSIRFVW